jgi:hypothetical protein
MFDCGRDIIEENGRHEKAQDSQSMIGFYNGISEAKWR